MNLVYFPDNKNKYLNHMKIVTMDFIESLIRDGLSVVGITTCSRCLTHTKIQYEGHNEYGEPKGYTICPRCNHRDAWCDDQNDAANVSL